MVTKIKLGELQVKPGAIFKGEVKASGNGAAIGFPKRYIGKEVYIILKEKTTEVI